MFNVSSGSGQLISVIAGSFPRAWRSLPAWLIGSSTYESSPKAIEERVNGMANIKKQCQIYSDLQGS